MKVSLWLRAAHALPRRRLSCLMGHGRVRRIPPLTSVATGNSFGCIHNMSVQLHVNIKLSRRYSGPKRYETRQSISDTSVLFGAPVLCESVMTKFQDTAWGRLKCSRVRVLTSAWKWSMAEGPRTADCSLPQNVQLPEVSNFSKMQTPTNQRSPEAAECQNDANHPELRAGNSLQTLNDRGAVRSQRPCRNGWQFTIESKALINDL